MRLATFVLKAALALAMGLSGNALADGSGWHSHGHGYAGDVYAPRHRGRHRHYKPRYAHRPWRHSYWRHCRPYYRLYYRGGHDHDDSWYGVHLFFGGH